MQAVPPPEPPDVSVSIVSPSDSGIRRRDGSNRSGELGGPTNEGTGQGMGGGTPEGGGGPRVQRLE
jgi:hypothetical protein